MAFMTAAFEARRHPPDEPIDREGSYVRLVNGAALFAYPDDSRELTWRLWSSLAYGLRAFVQEQHFEQKFSFMLLQDWPPGQ